MRNYDPFAGANPMGNQTPPGYPKQVYVNNQPTWVNTPQEEQAALSGQSDWLRYQSGSPTAPESRKTVDANGNLLDQYRITDQTDTRALDRYRSEGLRDPGADSVWAKLMKEQLNTEKLQGSDDLTRSLASSRAGLISNLAATGGANSGARERAFGNSMKTGILERQKMNRDFATRNQGIGIKDEENRIGQLGNLTGMENQRAGYLTDIQKTNNSSGLQGVRDSNQLDLDKWKTNMESWAANKQADAQSKAACFPPDTLIKMNDGSFQALNTLMLGQITFLGGKVCHIINALNNDPSDVYDYKGVIVTGGHAVFENDQFVRVNQSKQAIKIDYPLPIVMNLTTDNHVVVIGDQLFADYEEVDIPKHPSETLKELTSEFRKAIS